MIIDRDWIQSIRAGLCTAPLRSLGRRCETAVSNPLLRCCRMLHPLRRKNFMSKAPWRASIAAMRAIATMPSLAAIGLCRRARVTHWRRHAGRAGKGTLEVGESELQQAHCTNCEAAPPGSQHAGLMPTWSQPRKSKSPASASIALRSGCAPVVGILLVWGPGRGEGKGAGEAQKNAQKQKLFTAISFQGPDPEDGETGGQAARLHPSPPRSFRTGGLTSPSHGRSQRGTRRDGAPADSAACPCRRRK